MDLIQETNFPSFKTAFLTWMASEMKNDLSPPISRFIGKLLTWNIVTTWECSEQLACLKDA